MKTTVSLYDFRDSFKRMGRDKQFTYEGLGVLFQYLEDYEEITNEEIELDVVAICCDFTEDTWLNIADSYSIDLTDAELGGEKYEIVKNYLYDQGALVGEVDGGFVYRNDF
jgi:hypothetical protein